MSVSMVTGCMSCFLRANRKHHIDSAVAALSQEMLGCRNRVVNIANTVSCCRFIYNTGGNASYVGDWAEGGGGRSCIHHV